MAGTIALVIIGLVALAIGGYFLLLWLLEDIIHD